MYFHFLRDTIQLLYIYTYSFYFYILFTSNKVKYCTFEFYNKFTHCLLCNIYSADVFTSVPFVAPCWQYMLDNTIFLLEELQYQHKDNENIRMDTETKSIYIYIYIYSYTYICFPKMIIIFKGNCDKLTSSLSHATMSP